MDINIGMTDEEASDLYIVLTTINDQRRFPIIAKPSEQRLVKARVAAVMDRIENGIRASREAQSCNNVEHIRPQVKEWVKDAARKHGVPKKTVKDWLAGIKDEDWKMHFLQLGRMTDEEIAEFLLGKPVSGKGSKPKGSV